MLENAGFRELKQGWYIDKFPVKKENAVRAHSILTLTLYALSAAYHTDRGQKALQKGIRRLRRENFQSIHKIVIYSGNYFGIYDIDIRAYGITESAAARINTHEYEGYQKAAGA